MKDLQLLGMTHLSIEKSPRELNSLVLAYLGDAVYELYVRHHLVAKGVVRPQDLQKAAIRFVSAKAQAEVLRSIESDLSPEEIDVFKRGRNAKSGSVPKHAKVSDYRSSTGLEALIGYLYVNQNEQRLQQLMQAILQQVERESFGDE
ncbi:Mini-ribonuclease 3 [Hazenella coriacea]|uniref:Mini-ribonuclease 3 n=1 Tax=Hazenella coriacea TaxID=1179467 RepID=A0A4R3L3K0_9BACL|nr:Mini-ribonuclease 3 [Hazenella coriacea]TCS94223.1 ribonuclease-3 family protein [Hazenella coriacea]